MSYTHLQVRKLIQDILSVSSEDDNIRKLCEYNLSQLPKESTWRGKKCPNCNFKSPNASKHCINCNFRIVKAKPAVEMPDFSSDCCRLCGQGFDVSDTFTLECGHKYHKKCLVEWVDVFDLGTQCPTCRQSRIPIESLRNAI
tara:strand:+ start:395 stop:820 length:426 start_codon:yes stop_codon:yes gene_type:complete